MPIFSGRLDQWDSEEELLTFFICFIEQYECTDIILAFEDKTKTGLPCKPHYHFLFKCKSTHDTLRRYISKEPNLKGSNSSIKTTDDYDKAACYTLKQFPDQQYVPLYDFGGSDDEDLQRLIQYIDKSIHYQESITLNTWKEHIKVIIELIQKKYTKYFPSRLDIFNDIYEYVYDWNQKEKVKHVSPPMNIKKDIAYIESQILPKKEFMARMLLDHQHLIYDHDIKERAYEHNNVTQITKITTAHQSKYFEDSDDDERTNLDI